MDGSALTIQYFIRDVFIQRAAARNGIASFDLLPGTYRLDSGQGYEFEVDGSGSITITDATGTLIASGASQITVDPSKVLRLNVDGSFLPGLYFIRDVFISRGARRSGIASFDVLPGNYRIEHSGNTASFAVDSNCNLTPPPPYSLGGIPVPVTCGGANSPPVADAGGPYSVDEGGSVTVVATGSDPDDDSITFAWDLDNNGTFETPGQSVPFSAAGLDGPSTQTIAVQVTDDGGLSATVQATVNVQNVAPTAGTITAPVDPVQVGTEINAGASFTDPGTPDTHTAIWDWGDNSTSAGTVDQASTPSR